MLLVAGAVWAVPVLVGLGARWAGLAEVQELRTANESLRTENDSYKAATGELAEQIASLQSAITQLGDQNLDPKLRDAIEKLPAVVKSRAMGGTTTTSPTQAAAVQPDRTFGILRDLLDVLGTRLNSVRKGVESRQALAAATPSIWPLVSGWLSSSFGVRQDPLTGGKGYHEGLDLSADSGTPVHATADGVVEDAGYNGNYGNCILVNHGFGIETRYGHLSRYSVRAGDKVTRGQVIGYVGSTGRTTGPHLHYEILLNGQQVDPLKFLTQ